MIEENFAAKQQLQLVVPAEMSSLWSVRVQKLMLYMLLNTLGINKNIIITCLDHLDLD